VGGVSALNAWPTSARHILTLQHHAMSASLKPEGYTWSFLARRTGRLFPIWQPYTGTLIPVMPPARAQGERMGEQLSLLVGHEAIVTFLGFCPAVPHALLSSSYDGTCRIWNAVDAATPSLVLNASPAFGPAADRSAWLREQPIAAPGPIQTRHSQAAAALPASPEELAFGSAADAVSPPPPPLSTNTCLWLFLFPDRFFALVCSSTEKRTQSFCPRTSCVVSTAVREASWTRADLRLQMAGC
jgi:WD40 repeat protein